MKVVLHFVLLSFLVFACSDSKIENEGVKLGLIPYHITGNTMGTSYSVKVIDKKEKIKEITGILKPSIDNELNRVNSEMSTYIPVSEISRFNKNKTDKWVKVSPGFFTVTKEALRIGTLSEGALDITVGALVNLWGFGPEHRPEKIPNKVDIENVLKSIGLDKIEIDSNKSALKKTNGEIKIDLSSIAKGFGVDVVCQYLEKIGLTNYMVEIGGEVRTSGVNSQNKNWRIGISRPEFQSGLQEVLKISGYSMATSGDYLNYFEEDGIRYSHTIDPRTGKPITHNLASVTVIHKSCMTADGFATAINVLGPEKGKELAERLELPVLMIVRENNKFVEIRTKSFEKFIVK